MFDIVKLIVSVKPMDMFQKYFVNAFFLHQVGGKFLF